MESDKDLDLTKEDLIGVLLRHREITDAIFDYTRSARHLCWSLAEAQGLPRKAVHRTREICGVMDEEWAWEFHGLQCRFHNIKTDQIVEAELTFGGDYGVIDPWFLQVFIQSTPRHRHLMAFIDAPENDIWKLARVLVHCGFFVEVEATAFPGRHAYAISHKFTGQLLESSSPRLGEN